MTTSPAMSEREPDGPDWRNPVHVLAFGLGAGAAPVAPGTIGTLVGLVVYVGIAGLPLPAYLAVLGVLVAAGIAICGRTAADLGVHDHPGIVWDEIAGLLVALCGVPVGWQWAAAGFALFRVFDILKPWPIHSVDRRVGGGLGIMADDILAGLCAAAVLHATAWWLGA
jgi:phosphatidylglycerophosphatase A